VEYKLSCKAAAGEGGGRQHGSGETDSACTGQGRGDGAFQGGDGAAASNLPPLQLASPPKQQQGAGTQQLGAGTEQQQQEEEQQQQQQQQQQHRRQLNGGSQQLRSQGELAQQQQQQQEQQQQTGGSLPQSIPHSQDDLTQQQQQQQQQQSVQGEAGPSSADSSMSNKQQLPGSPWIGGPAAAGVQANGIQAGDSSSETATELLSEPPSTLSDFCSSGGCDTSSDPSGACACMRVCLCMRAAVGGVTCHQFLDVRVLGCVCAFLLMCLEEGKEGRLGLSPRAEAHPFLCI